MTIIDWETIYAAVWRRKKTYLRPVTHIDPISLSGLVGVEQQKSLIITNTTRFLASLPANNALLWGSRGTGKSSLIKAIFNQYKSSGLRIIGVDKDDLTDLAIIVDEIRDQPYKYIIFCDDLSFEAGEANYKHLKSVLEGSLEMPPDNVLIYATSNRRHLLPEYIQDNLQAKLVGTEIHHGDAVEEKISLADRFGLWISFYPIGREEYLRIVDSYFDKFKGNRAQLHEEAWNFALLRANKSGRTAKQFYNHYYKPQ